MSLVQRTYASGAPARILKLSLMLLVLSLAGVRAIIPNDSFPISGLTCAVFLRQPTRIAVASVS